MKKSKRTMTRNQLKKLEKEQKQLKEVKRAEIAARLQDIKNNINMSNDMLYLDVKDEQRRIEARISEIDYILQNSVIEEALHSNGNRVLLGSRVRVRDIEYDEEAIYSIVNTNDTNSLMGRISNESPMGKALLGKTVGETVTFSVGSMTSRFKILRIEGMEKGFSQEVSKISKSKNPDIIEEKDVTSKDFITRVNVFKCISNDHKLIDIKCRIRVMLRNGNIETCIVPGAYCKTCGKYYMLESDFKNLKLKGILICKIVEKDFWINGNQNGFSNLNKESLIHLMGYNVSAQSDLSKEQRWGILELIVDEGILSVMEIRSHLTWLIRRNRNNSVFSDARLKWETDIKHISEYRSEDKKVVDVNSISVKNYRKK